MIKLKKQKTIYQDQWTNVVQDIFSFDSSREITYTYISRNDGVVGFILNQNEEILLIEQYRHPINGFSWELPGRGVDEGEDLESALKREIFEEAGIKIDSIEPFGTYYPTTSLSTEKEFVYLAQTQDTITEKEHGEADEFIRQVKFFPLEKVIDMIQTGELNEAITVLTVYKYLHLKNG